MQFCTEGVVHFSYKINIIIEGTLLCTLMIIVQIIGTNLSFWSSM